MTTAFFAGIAAFRLLESRDDFHFERALGAMDAEDMPPINSTGAPRRPAETSFS